jgi:hypothetical protein
MGSRVGSVAAPVEEEKEQGAEKDEMDERLADQPFGERNGKRFPICVCHASRRGFSHSVGDNRVGNIHSNS